MSHEIESMMYSGDAPWHRLGTRVEGLQTADQAMIASGLDWVVTTEDVSVNGQVLPDYKAICRPKDGKIYNIVSAQYAPVQNVEAFKFFDAVIASGAAKYETAGSLRGGARTFILANCGAIGIAGDEITKYILLANSHDGSLALQMFFTPVRVVCQNTLSMALSRAGERAFYAKHTAGATDRVREAQQVMGLTEQWYAAWSAQATKYTMLMLPAPQPQLLLEAAFAYDGGKAKPAADVITTMTVQMEHVMELAETGRGQRDNPAIRGTAWAYYNAICEYTDRYKVYKGGTDEARTYGAWFGTGGDMKRRAWNWLEKNA